jgi:hypothetical protein
MSQVSSQPGDDPNEEDDDRHRRKQSSGHPAASVGGWARKSTGKLTESDHST